MTEFEILYLHFRAGAEGNLHQHSRTLGPGPAGMQQRSATIWRHALVMLSHDLCLLLITKAVQDLCYSDNYVAV